MPRLSVAQWGWLALLAIALVAAQIDQPYPDVAPLHHIPTLLLLIAAPWLLRRWPISNASLGCVVVFFLLHTLGGRYTYTNLPYDEWYRSLTGGDLSAITGWQRNNYDRLVHFAFGVLSVLPVVEVMRMGGLKLRGALWSALAFVLAVSCLYEIVEWLLGIVLAGEMADQYNGQQGDIWDAQKDMALAALGSLVSIGAIALRARGTRA
ncbi:DUF2238 domain-containing protein [Erythrobacter sp. SG61-1L]|uniref:DUF2238 domain-containing protein n=1 Tax=Erythrobacter sp. SG61-1L TaxID=1603897 RepID=UPI0006C92163|nr:DUF2238 domain-containing protein [Erythrobacter sp. SG61-1L]